MQGAGVVDYLLLNFDQSMTNGTFTWTTDLNAARQNAFALYPNTEGIDAREGKLLFVSKVRKAIFTLDLQLGTWFVSSTVSGLFDGQPDQIQRLLLETLVICSFSLKKAGGMLESMRETKTPDSTQLWKAHYYTQEVRPLDYH